jgi:hypothetical protein
MIAGIRIKRLINSAAAIAKRKRAIYAKHFFVSFLINIYGP